MDQNTEKALVVAQDAEKIDSSLGQLTPPTIIEWEDGDPEDSMNWEPRKKWKTIASVASMASITALGSTIIAPATPQIMLHFQSTNYDLAVLVVSINILGYAVGPLFLSPLSEIYGRASIYHITNAFFVITAIACALAPSLGSLIGFRFLNGIAASVPAAVGGGTIADIFAPSDRGKATSVYGLGVIVGPIIGPVIGGPLAQHKGWRWVFWLLAILGGAMTILTVVLYKETYRPVLLKRKLIRVRRELGDNSLNIHDDRRTPSTILKQALIRPFKLLFLSPAVAIACFASGLTFFYFYLLVATFPRVFEDQYGFNPTEVGLSYFGLGIGNLLGLVFFAATSDRYLARVSKRREVRPEDRLAPIYLGSPIIGIGFLWYGWSADKQLHWIMPIIGTTLFGFGFVAYMMPVILYLIDSWKLFAASAVATNVFLRSVVGALLPLVAGKLYDRLGLGWGNSLLALIAFVTTPLPWLYYRHGQYLRERFHVQL